MKAFVTGATGFLGTHLLQALTNDGWTIYAFHRPTSDLTEIDKFPQIIRVTGDVRDRDSLERGMPEGLDAVFHAAGSVGFLTPKQEQHQYDINELGTRNVVDIALAKGARRFVYTSTVLTYDFSTGRRITEHSPANSVSNYAYIHSKYRAELEVERGVERGLDAVFIHPSAIFGAYDKSTWSKMFREIDAGLRVPAAPPGKLSLCHMRKVAEAHVSAFHKGRKGEHYVLGGVDANYLELGGAIAAILNRRSPRFVVPAPLFRVLAWVEYRISTLLGREPMATPALADILCATVLCDSTKAIQELGYVPSNLHTMLQDCYDWMVSTHMLPARS